MANLTQNDVDAIITGLTNDISNRQDFINAVRGPQGPWGPQGPQSIVANNNQLIDTRWRIEEFGLFEPDLVIDDRHPPGDVITIGRDSIYQNVDAFCERIRDAIATKGAETVRDNLHLCLRSAATRWLTFEVSEIDKLAIRGENTLQLTQWTARLLVRFRPRMAQAVRENSELTFTHSNMREEKKVLTYFQSKILKSRAAGFESLQGQLIQVYSGIEVMLRRDLFEPTPQTTLDQYREILLEKEELWIEVYKARTPSRVAAQRYGQPRALPPSTPVPPSPQYFPPSALQYRNVQ
jgi:hypothetical protein